MSEPKSSHLQSQKESQWGPALLFICQSPKVTGKWAAILTLSLMGSMIVNKLFNFYGFASFIFHNASPEHWGRGDGGMSPWQNTSDQKAPLFCALFMDFWVRHHACLKSCESMVCLFKKKFKLIHMIPRSRLARFWVLLMQHNSSLSFPLKGREYVRRCQIG